MAKRWYSVSVLSNFEKKIAEQIRQSVEEQGLEEQKSFTGKTVQEIFEDYYRHSHQNSDPSREIMSLLEEIISRGNQ